MIKPNLARRSLIVGKGKTGSDYLINLIKTVFIAQDK